MYMPADGKVVLFLFCFTTWSFTLISGASISDLLDNEDEFTIEYNLQLATLQNENKTVAELIQDEGYPGETHTVTTSDGYILTVHRIPYGKNNETNGKVAFLQHGLISSSADWILAGSNKALGYILADAGYDVWMGNARGNTQSRKHVSLNPDTDAAFWQFSWHEIGIIDVPQMIDYILEETNASSVYYVGHSQGSTTFYVMTSMLPEYNDKIKVSVSLAPVAYMKHVISPLVRLAAYWEKPVSVLTSLVGVNEFLPQSDFLKLLSNTVCSTNSVTQILCTNAVFAICGFSPEQFNTTMLPTIMYYTPAGASSKQIFHYAQEIVSGKFRQYDWGWIKNLIKYKWFKPTSYSLSSITAPVHLIYSLNDWLSAKTDVQKLCANLGNCQEMRLVQNLLFNHLDFLYGIDANSLVYSQIISIFEIY